MVVNRENKDYNLEASLLVEKIKEKYPYGARSTDYWDILKLCLGIDDWQLMSFMEIQNGSFDAYIMDCTREFISDNGVELEEIYKATLSVGEFSQTEKRVMEKANINNVLYAILLVISGIKLNKQND